MRFFKCVLYLASTGIIAFFVGRLLPKKWFKSNVFPYRSFAFEQEGRIYDKIHIRKWQNKVPDMSKIFPKWMPAKNLSGDYKARLPLMLQETCIAEWIHFLNCIAGLYCLKILPGIGGSIIVILYITLFNLPFIIIQRYNRPRLQRLNNRVKQAEMTVKGEAVVCEC